MAQVQAIHGLRARGWSFRRIGRELGIHRDTVKRYVELAALGAGGGDSSRAGAAGTDSIFDGQNRPNPPAGSTTQNRPNPPSPSGPASKAEPYREAIIHGLERGLSRQRIWQDLKTQHGFTGSYDCVKRLVRRLESSTPLPFRRMECAPGEEAQIDFGTGAPVDTPDGSGGLGTAGIKTRRRKTHVFRIVLSHSRKGYSEAVYRQTTEQFIRCMENAFCHFGGVPRTLVIDNLKAAVSKADWFDPELNPKVQAFCAHYSTVILPTKPYTPRHKGKVEKGVDYVQDNALKGKTFGSLAEQNAYLLDWETTVADTRIHGTTRKQVKKAFEEVERSALSPLPSSRFPFFEEGRRKVNRDGHVEVDKAYYSAPPEYLGRQVWARWDSRVVRIFNHRMEQIAFHAKHEAGRFSTQELHIAPQKRGGVEKGATYLLQKTNRIGDQTSQWVQQMLHQRGIEGVRVLLGLLSLAQQHPTDSIEQACEIASTHGAYRLRTIRKLIQQQQGKQDRFAFIEEHPIIRSMADYGELVSSSLGKESSYA